MYMLDGGSSPDYRPNPRLARALVGGRPLASLRLISRWVAGPWHH